MENLTPNDLNIIPFKKRVGDTEERPDAGMGDSFGGIGGPTINQITDVTETGDPGSKTVILRVLGSTSIHAVSTSVGGDFECPLTGTISEIGAWVDTAGTTGDAVIDVNKNGSSILYTPISIDSGEKTSRTGSPAAVLADTAISQGDLITVDIDTIQTTPAWGLVVRFKIT